MRTVLVVLAILAVLVAPAVLASIPTPARAYGQEETAISRTITLYPAGTSDRPSMHRVSFDCVQDGRIHYSWNSTMSCRFFIVDPSGRVVEELTGAMSAYSAFEVRSKGPHVLQWNTISPIYRLNLTYTVINAPPATRSSGSGQGDDGSQSPYMDGLLLAGFFGIGAGIFSIAMILSACYFGKKPWRRRGMSVERQCLMMYSGAYSGMMRPPEATRPAMMPTARLRRSR